MILVYNFLLSILTLLALPVLVPVVLVMAKYRGRTMERLGCKTQQIKKILSGKPDRTKTIWIHALSVGEVTSALPLVKALRRELPPCVLVFTVATSSGKQVADHLIAPFADTILYSPFDFRVSVKRYFATIQPDIFILIETDFWPNLLFQLNRKNIPVMLVNGRISQKSFAAYTRFRFFFTPLFRCFSLLSMQTKADSTKMIDLGIAPAKVITLGNLKYDMDIGTANSLQPGRKALGIADQSPIFICGSTHPGEEEILFAAFAKLTQHHHLFCILAPRDISRGKELVELAASFSLKAFTRSGKSTEGTVLILDTLGELASCYRLARLAFVGGSLVSQGGHNPIEPAMYGVPVLFGPHMEDFAEIARDLLQSGGAKRITSTTLTETASAILTNRQIHESMAENGRHLVRQHRGTMTRHVQKIQQLLDR